MLHKLQASMVWRSSHDTGRVLIRVNCTNCDFDVILSTQINLVKVNSSWQACYLKQSVNIRSILFWNHQFMTTLIHHSELKSDHNTFYYHQIITQSFFNDNIVLAQDYGLKGCGGIQYGRQVPLFQGPCCSIFWVGYTGNRFFQNVGAYLSNYSVSRSRRL